LRPASLFTACFMGESNIIEGRATAVIGGEVRVATPLGEIVAPGSSAIGATVHLALRPEQLLLDLPPDGFFLGEAEISEMSFQGPHQRCRCRIGGLDFVLRAPVTAGLGPGARVRLHGRKSDLVLLARQLRFAAGSSKAAAIADKPPGTSCRVS